MDSSRFISALSVLLALFCVRPAVSAQESNRLEGNSAKLICSGEDFYRELAGAFENASNYICFEYYSVGQDSVSTAILSLLQKKAEEGVSVYAIIDDYGSRHRDLPMDSGALEQYRSQGLDIAVFNRRSFNTPLPRDHRKLSIVDGVTAFVGGMNLNDLQIGRSERLGTVHDLSVRLDGPVAGLLATEFEKTWNEWAGRGELSLSPATSAPAGSGIAVGVCPTEGWEYAPTVRSIYKDAVDSADSTIVLVNAYPMPSAPILHALKAASRRGVKIDIVTGDRTDLPKVLKNRPARILESLSRSDNISVHVVRDSFIHAKAMSVDSKILLLGSANLDYLSRTTNLELCVTIEDAGIASQYDNFVLSLEN